MVMTVEDLQLKSISNLGILGEFPNKTIFPDKRAIAEFVKPNCMYLNSAYNATTNNVIWHAFVSDDYLMHVNSDNSLNIYRHNLSIDNFVYDFVEINSDGSPIAYLLANDDGFSFSEYNFQTKAKQITINSQTYDEMPQDKQAMVENFPYKDRIFSWSEQPAGLIIEYIEPLTQGVV